MTKRLIATALLTGCTLFAPAPNAVEASWSFGVAGFNAEATFTPLATQFTFTDREQCERALRGMSEHGFVVFGTPAPASTSAEATTLCWNSGRRSESPGPPTPAP